MRVGIKISRTVLIRGLQSSSCNKKQEYAKTIYMTVLKRVLLLKMQVDALLVVKNSIYFARANQQDCRNKWNWVVIRKLKSPSLTARVEHIHEFINPRPNGLVRDQQPHEFLSKCLSPHCHFFQYSICQIANYRFSPFAQRHPNL